MWNVILGSRGSGLLSGGMETSFVSVYGSKLGLSELAVDRTLFGLAGGETCVAVLV